ncbi:MAG: methyltransferase, partial [Lachnospiraceae bacterium]|nr:methyltransferase [Lachnospiraceae bacterium]
MDVHLLPGERIDDLERNGYRIIQNKNGFCFGMDAVLLSGFVQAGKKDKIIDLGTGTGILPLLLRAKTGSKDITGLEIQEQVAEMAARSVKLNDLEDD